MGKSSRAMYLGGFEGSAVASVSYLMRRVPFFR